MVTETSTLAGSAGDAAAGSLLSIRDLRVMFRSRSGREHCAVDGLSLELPATGALAVVGESGSGKTVSMRSLLRLLPATAHVTGQAQFAGRDLIGLAPEELRAISGQQIGMVFQNAMEAFNPTRTLKQQLTEHLRWHKVCGRKEALERAIDVLDRVGIPEPARRIRMYPFQLSGGMLQRAMIGMAIIGRPQLLIADEPTTAMDVTVQRQVLDLLRDLRQTDGLSMIMITHDLGVARYTCDDVVVMREGRVVETGQMARFDQTASHPYSRELLEAALDVDTTTMPATQDTAAAATSASAGSGDHSLVQASDLGKIFHGTGGTVHAVSDVNLSIGAGEAVGVVGESGSGKSTLARLLLRLVDTSSGAISFGGTDLVAADNRQLRQMRRSVQMVFQNPYGSLMPHMSVAANVAEPLRVHRVGTGRERRARAVELLDLVGIPPQRRDHYPRQLSGGQQQRVAIARALALDPALLVCDEPTSALDVSIQAEILRLLADLRERLHLSLLFITHNLAVAQQLCDRIVVMAGGYIVETAPTTDLFTHPAHAYTRELLAAVLPAHGDPLSSQPAQTSGIAAGTLIEISPGHWVRRTQEETHQPPRFAEESMSTKQEE